MTPSDVLSYGRQDIDESDVDSVSECLRSDWLTQGPRVEEFEQALAARTGARFAVAVANGTAALHLVYRALGFGPRQIGIAPAITFVATANGFLYSGGGVALADVVPETGLIDLTDLERLVDELKHGDRSPTIIAPVDYAGQPVDRERVAKIAEEASARVVEDAAHSLGASYRVGSTTRPVGSCSHADAAILSFHPVKHITTGEGGAVLTNDPSLERTLRDLRSHGIHRDRTRFTRSVDDPLVGPWYYEQATLGFNYRLTDFQCALGTSQLRRLDAFIERRRKIASSYDGALREAPLAQHFEPLHQNDRTENAYHLYVIRVRRREGETTTSLAARRKALYVALRDLGIACQVHYIPVHLQPYYSGHSDVLRRPLPGAEAFYAGVLSIPMFPAMTDAHVARVLESLAGATRRLNW